MFICWFVNEGEILILARNAAIILLRTRCADVFLVSSVTFNVLHLPGLSIWSITNEVLLICTLFYCLSKIWPAVHNMIIPMGEHIVF